MDSGKLLKDLQELADKLDGGVTVPALEVKELPEQEKYLTRDALSTLKFKVTKLVGPVTPEWKTLFFSARVKSEENIPAAAHRLADEVNILQSLEVLKGCLAPLSTVKLAGDLGWGVFIFPVVKWYFDPTCYSEVLDTTFLSAEGVEPVLFDPVLHGKLVVSDRVQGLDCPACEDNVPHEHTPGWLGAKVSAHCEHCPGVDKPHEQE